MLITDKKELKQYSAEYRLWQGIPSIEVTKKGRIFLTFYSGGTKESIGNYSMVIKSDDGVNFSEPIAVAYVDEHRCYDPCLWIDPLGRLWFTWGYAPENMVYGTICDDPDADELQWGEVFAIGKEVMMNKPTVLSTGEWLFPVAVWHDSVRMYDFDCIDKRGSFVYKTTDNGKTFKNIGGADVPDRSFDEHMVLELNDGRLMMLVRTEYGIGVSYSYDRGHNWTEGKPSGLAHPSSRFHIRRLASGKVLLIKHHNFTGRNNLAAFLSDDDCKTWKWMIMLDERNEVSYPDVTERDGYIYVTYDRERGCFMKSLEQTHAKAREILYAKITEEDIIAGKLVNPGSKLKVVASKLGEYKYGDPYGDADLYPVENAIESFINTYGKEKTLEHIFEYYNINCTNLHKYASQEIDDLIVKFKSDEGTTEDAANIIKIIRSVTVSTKDSAPIIDSIRKYIDDNISNLGTVKDIAKNIGISYYYMSHLFKKITGATVIEYINEQKVTKAKMMLISGDANISDIAYECGFSSASYFAKIFAKSEGITPNEYRKLH